MTDPHPSFRLPFNTEAMIKPKTKADVSALLDEALAELANLNECIKQMNVKPTKEVK